MNTESPSLTDLLNNQTRRPGYAQRYPQREYAPLMDTWTRGQLDPSTIAEHVLATRLAQTVAWCKHQLTNRTSDATMRSLSLRPPVLHDGIDDALCSVGSNRQYQLKTDLSIEVEPGLELAGGRLICFFPDANLSDGAAEPESDGYFDALNIPGWETWVTFADDPKPADNWSKRYLVAYVPPDLLELARRGIIVNPEECIGWLDDFNVTLRDRFRSG